MSDANGSRAAAFDFSRLVPGFDFLKSLTNPVAAGGAVPGLPSLSSWVAPTLSVEEVDKRIQELKAVQYWLEQNGHALKATIQALEVQKMTLSTLRGMNVRMEDLANAFTRNAQAAAESTAAAVAPAAAPAAPAPAAPAPEPPQEEAPAPEPPRRRTTRSAAKAAPGGASAPGVVDPLQWWNALTDQFQQIATATLQEAAKLGTPPAAGGPAVAKATRPKEAAARRAPAKRTPRKAVAARKKKPAPARRRTGASP